MTPAARIQTAIEILDEIVGGAPAERSLTRWARSARHAGSKDRAAVRDLVFDILRRWWSSAVRGGNLSGRARMIGYLRETGGDLDAIFTGARYAPAPLTDAEILAGDEPEGSDRFDAPDWLLPQLRQSLGDDCDAVLEALRHRAPVHVRVNTRRMSRDEAREALAAEDIASQPAALCDTALDITSNPRRLQSTQAYRDGTIELQDAASQAIVDLLPLSGAQMVLDYCAGGGGKTLAMAARHDATYHAHDADPKRLADLPERAIRAGVRVDLRQTSALEVAYDLVLTDVPCSGSGAWRRAPEGKIRFMPERLDQLADLQSRILGDAWARVRPGGHLAYATCSLLDAENGDQVARFLGSHDAQPVVERRFTPLDGGDGFFCAVLKKL
ncbi:RsmB/NOP family class I SAM-dependent RNA methyltransferase [Palleronia caenipelagi]|uniref:RsmB/NOP family class I SAM-dependent RNA methyltransferase n=1 Tax=Palleronia caenipelagi TaxID=2489174 RepID=A0A547PNI4_9RHOB|nr:RsmB/NOP family class I SAM-dependent RNA methyltransferase [Palleronia caenipelagi]TRD15707.1 RsmB/NOP family class I SAM-dependent RNA methyltransferase [Palleronia caenipelagi]